MVGLKISVIVCTYNRAGYLGACIDSLFKQSLASSSYEIIVVDNNSSDDTQQVCRGYSEADNFMHVLESKQGLSHARNRGYQESRAPLVAYIDDDAVAAPEWLAEIVKGFECVQVGSVGGPILPVYEASKPSWLHDSLLPLYSCRDRGRALYDLEPGNFFYGVNMAFRKEILERVGGFPTFLGRTADNLLSDEELVVGRKVQELGYKKRYMPDAGVLHTIPQYRLQAGWLLRRFYWLGKGEAIREKRAADSLIKFTIIYILQVKSALSDLIRPEYKAGWFTILIPVVTLIGYSESFLFVRRRN